MTRTVHCDYLRRDAEGLDYSPWPGALGQRVFAHISKEGWRAWLAHQTMLINENRLSPMKPADRVFLQEQMERFLFGGENAPPPGYVPEAE